MLFAGITEDMASLHRVFGNFSQLLKQKRMQKE